MPPLPLEGKALEVADAPLAEHTLADVAPKPALPELSLNAKPLPPGCGCELLPPMAGAFALNPKPAP